MSPICQSENRNGIRFFKVYLKHLMKITGHKFHIARVNTNHNFGLGLVTGTLTELSSKLDYLSKNELDIYRSFKHDPRKTSYLLGRISAKTGIQALTGIIDLSEQSIDTGIFEFPILRSTSVYNTQVSITHCNNIGISIAYPEEHPMGIDLEEIKTESIEILSDQLTQKEMRLSSTLFSDDSKGFTLLWTAKEALSKVFKTGLMLDFKTLEIDKMTRHGDIWESTFFHCGQYKVLSYFFGSYVCSLVLPKHSAFDLNEYVSIFDGID